MLLDINWDAPILVKPKKSQQERPMLIPVSLKCVDRTVFAEKLSRYLSALEQHDPQLSICYQALSPADLAPFLAYDLPDLKAIYERLNTGSSTLPELWFPAYCRMRRLLDLLDTTQSQLPLLDCQGHIFQTDLEFLCQADLSRLLSLQDALDMLGLEVQIVE